MLKKMIEALKKRYSNLGLSEEMLSKVAPMLVNGLSDDADEAAIDARASESYVSDMLKAMQSQADKIRTLEVKLSKSPKDNKGDEPDPGEPKDNATKEILELLKAQKESNEAMQKRLEALEGASKVKSFDEKFAAYAKELNVPASLLGLFRDGLSPDMEEKAMKDAMGAKKKSLLDAGVKFTDSQVVTVSEAQKEAERKEASDWVKEHAIE